MKNLLAVVLLASAALASAQEVTTVGTLTLSQPWVRATPGGAKNGAAYLVVNNAGRGDVLQSASSPVAGTVELHTHLNDNGVMRMRQVPEIVIPAQQKVALQPGGLHIMLIDLKAPLKVGDTVPLTLRFETAGSVQLDVPVKAVTAMPMPMPAQEMSHRH